MKNPNDPRCNSEGYPDPTAYKAIKNIEKERSVSLKELESSERFHQLLHTLLYICDLADFKIEGRVILIDKKTGRIWK